MKFYLITPAQEKSIIYIDVLYQKKRFRLSTEISVLSKYWNQEKQIVENDFPLAKQLNKTLSGYKNRIEQLLLDLKFQKIYINKNEFHTQLSLIIKPNIQSISVQIKEKINLLELYKSYFENRRELNNISQATYIQNLSNYRILKIFEEKRGSEITFENINMEFYRELSAFYIIERKNTNRKINTNIKLFKVFLRDCLNKGIYDNIEILKSPKLSEKTTDNLLALTSDELEKIRTCELDERLKITRDLFLFQVQTLLRFSDLMNIQPENIDIRLKELKLWQLKTSEPLIIPLTNFAIEFIKQNKPFPKYSLAKYISGLGACPLL